MTRIPTTFASGILESEDLAFSSNLETEEVFVLEIKTGKVRTLSLATPTTSIPTIRTIYTNQYENMEVSTLLFVHQTQSLIVCCTMKASTNPREFRLLCITRDGSQWVEKSSTQVIVPFAEDIVNTGASLCELPRSAVLLVTKWSECVVHIEFEAHKFGRVMYIDSKNEYNKNASAIERDGTTLVAFSEMNFGPLSLCALRDKSLVELSRIDKNNWMSVLWLNSQLVAVERNDEDKATGIVSFDTSGNRLERAEELLPAAAGVNPVAVCAAGGDRVVLWDWNSKDLIVYTCV